MIARLSRARIARLPLRARRFEDGRGALDEHFYDQTYRQYDEDADEDAAWAVLCSGCFLTFCSCPDCLPVARQHGAARLAGGRFACSRACRRTVAQRIRAMAPAPGMGVLACALRRAFPSPVER